MKTQRKPCAGIGREKMMCDSAKLISPNDSRLLYENLENVLWHIYFDVHAIYETVGRKIGETNTLPTSNSSENLKNWHDGSSSLASIEDGEGPFGDCYLAAVDLLKKGMTFRIYFKHTYGEKPTIEYVERWHFG